MKAENACKTQTYVPLDGIALSQNGVGWGGVSSALKISRLFLNIKSHKSKTSKHFVVFNSTHTNHTTDHKHTQTTYSHAESHSPNIQK